eukprot:GHVH01003672.1.p1 GENE.GHVH01003672.1~~GHVH01003672.1.p1  ORF type:complete len:368 (-),score=41.70 GHVH01003672.1:9-1112(-)
MRDVNQKTPRDSTDVDANDASLWSPASDPYTFPLGSIVCVDMDPVWRLTASMLWLCSAAPYLLGGVAGAENLMDDFHGVARRSLGSFIVRIIEFQVFHWEVSIESKQFKFPQSMRNDTLLHSKCKFWSSRGIQWFSIYQPNSLLLMKSTNIINDGTEAVAGDLEVWPLGYPAIYYANAILDHCGHSSLDPYSPFPLLPSPLSVTERVFIGLRNLMTMSIITCSKLIHDVTMSSTAFVSKDELVGACTATLVLMSHGLTHMHLTIRQTLDRYQLPVDVTSFIEKLTTILVALKAREVPGRGLSHNCYTWSPDIYATAKHCIALILGLLKPDDVTQIRDELKSRITEDNLIEFLFEVFESLNELTKPNI